MKKFLFLSLLVGFFAQINAQDLTNKQKEQQVAARKDKLQKQNQSLKKDIANLNKELKKNQAESKLSVAYVLNLDKKIDAQSTLVKNLNKEKRYIDDQIYLTQLDINKLSRELGELRKDYKQVLVKAYKNKSLGNKLLFVLSAESLNQAYRRIKYLEKYSDYQLQQAKEIESKQTSIIGQKNKKEKSKAEKISVINQQENFAKNLEGERVEKQKAVEEFKKNAGEIQSQIREKENEQRAVDGQIKKIIEEEIRLAAIRAENDKKAWGTARNSNTIAGYQKYLKEFSDGDFVGAAKKAIASIEADSKGWQIARSSHTKAAYQKYLNDFPRGQFTETAQKEVAKFVKAEQDEAAERAKIAAAKNVPVETVPVTEEKKPEPEKVVKADPKPVSSSTYTEREDVSGLSGAFENNKGKLPWPVSGGNVVSHFGKNYHPILKDIVTENSGVDIETSKGAVARCVFDGVVSQVSVIPGGSKSVLVRHGGYFTVYTNLATVSVGKGDQVKKGQNLGTVYTDSDNKTILKFQVWNGATKQNPASWVSGM